MKQLLSIFAGLVALWVLWILVLKPSPRTMISPVVDRETSVATVAAPDASEVAEPGIPSPPSQWPKPAEQKASVQESQPMPEASLESLAPPIQQIRREVRKDPHSTPESLLRFSVEIAGRMEAAMASSAEAEDLFTELEGCARAETSGGAPSVQALCLLNASRLADKFGPVLADRYARLEDDADERVLRLTNAVR